MQITCACYVTFTQAALAPGVSSHLVCQAALFPEQ